MAPLSRRIRMLLLLAAALGGAVWYTNVRQEVPLGAVDKEVGAEMKVSVPTDEKVRAGHVDGVPQVSPQFAAGALFSYERPPAREEIARLDRALAAPSRERHYVRVNTDWLAGKASPFWRKAGIGRVTWPLPDGGELAVVIEGSTMLGADRFTSTGRVEGRPESRVVFAWNEGFLHASVDDGERGNHVLRVANAEFAQVYRVDPELVAPCGGQKKRSSTGRCSRRRRGGRRVERRLGKVRSRCRRRTASAGVEVHAMMAVTQDVLATMSGAARLAALQSAFDAAFVRVNADLAASQVAVRVKLVKIAETTYDETKSAGSRVQDDALTALQSSTDGKMDEVHALRDQSGADLVCLLVNRADFASSGLAFVIDQPGDTTNAEFAFSVLQYGVLFGTRYLSHEFGHSFGCAHDRESALSPGAYPYSYGYRFFGADGQRYRDIMAYPPGIELGYFSNPNVVAPAPVSAPMGIPAGRAGESDTARTIEQAAFEVAGYRLQTQAPPAAGTLVNVATRASAGPEARVVIAGFTVTGTQPKAMLLRAAGPALTAFGVNDALAAPVLELYAGATRIAENARWSAQANADAITAASSSAGAFAFAPGSADAALLVTLAPGAYTTIVRGPAALGAVLIEAYETTSEASRIVNLSTRAFADKSDHPIVAGFVVRGGAGATKRILVRVLGPSLARAPFALPEAMDDPFMEIRDSAGALVLRNDDWSSGAEGGASQVNDFKPVVRYYNEKQIAATGLAPGNRREPCLLMDLPAGSYSVVVTPFELLPDSPAAPGIAIVEVYEIGAP
jgi:hypothetical protein